MLKRDHHDVVKGNEANVLITFVFEFGCYYHVKSFIFSAYFALATPF